jgi:hypothetical protein
MDSQKVYHIFFFGDLKKVYHIINACVALSVATYY